MIPQFNGSSYYRANPYYHQGYLPDSAYRNRRPQQRLGELPQGNQYFQPTNKKHFQRLGYYSTIAQQQLMNSAVRQANLSPIKDKEYFRSLNVNDIEGASTNTLISKAIKNRQKAHEQLSRRAAQMKQFERQRQIINLKIEDERKHIQATAKMNKGCGPNYHEMVKRKRTESQQSPGKVYEFPTNPSKQESNNRPEGKNMISSYRNELQKTNQEILQLEKQLNLVRQQKERAKLLHQNHQYSQHQQLSPTPITYTPRYEPQERTPPVNPEAYIPQYKKQHLSNYFQQHPQDANTIKAQRFLSQAHQINNFQYDNKKGSIGGLETPLTGRETRQQHRRFNPTFLSYGSAPIGIAGKNIVGY